MSRVVTQIIIAALLAVVGCAEPQKPDQPSNLPNGQNNVKPQPLSGGTGNTGNTGGTSGNGSGGSNSGGGGMTQETLKNILGYYDGYIFKSDRSGRVSQPFYMELSTADFQGATYMYVRLASEGAIGRIEISAYMGMFIYDSAYGRYFSFLSQMQQIGALYNMPVALEFNYFGPSQFLMYIKDCGFANDGVCYNQAQGVGFDQVTKRR